MRLSDFVPSLILESDREDAPWADWREGSALFADVSGFTPMSEALGALGAEGAEILTDVLNRQFAAMISVLAAHGGEVMKFGGDALLAFLPDDVSGARAISAGHAMQERMERFRRVRTPVRTFSLAMKVGVGTGRVVVGCVGDPALRRDWIFAGDAVESCVEAEHHASSGDVVVASVDASGAPEFRRARPADAPPAPPVRRRTSLRHLSDPPSVRSLVLAEVAATVDAGLEAESAALLPVVPVFLRFEGFSWDPERFDLARFDAFFRELVALAAPLGGRLNRVAMGDKGSTALFLFGAPRALEEKERMAALWGLEVRDAARRFPGVTVAAGLAAGRVFAGLVGGPGRSDYTVMGDTVNLAARLMQAAGPGEILGTESLFGAAAGLRVRALGERQFKGKAKAIAIAALESHDGRAASAGDAAADAPLAGRGAELGHLRAALAAAASGAPRVLVLEGDPGAGKSALARALAAEARAGGMRVLAGAADPGLAHRPWVLARELVLSALDAGGASAGEREARLLAAMPDAARRAHLAVIFDERSTVDADARDEPTAAAARAAAELLAAKGPALLLVENLHAADSNSLTLLAALAARLSEEPILVLATARPGWNHGAFAAEILPIEGLPASGLAELATARLGGPVRADLVRFLASRTGGNPLLAGRLLDELVRADLLARRGGEWAPEREAERLFSGSSAEILLAAVHRLPESERALLRLAAVAGVRFPAGLLDERPASARAIDRLVAAGHLVRSGPSELAFPQALVREAIYDALPKRFRTNAHRRFADLLSVLGAGDPGNLAAVARHFRLAARAAPAIDATLAAAAALAAAGSLREASEELAAAEGLLARRRGDPRRLTVPRELAELRLATGDHAAAVGAARIAARRARGSGSAPSANALLLEARLRSGELGAIAAARTLRTGGELTEAESFRLGLALGLALFRLGRSRDAIAHLSALAEVRSAPPAGRLEALRLLASILRKTGEPGPALRALEEAERLAAGSGAAERIRVRLELGTTLGEAGRSEESASLLEEVRRDAEARALDHEHAWAASQLGYLHWREGRLAEAGIAFEEAHRGFVRLGDRNAAAKALSGIAALAYARGDFEGAYSGFGSVVSILEATGHRSELPEALYNAAEAALDTGRPAEATAFLARGRASCGPEHAPIRAALDELERRLGAPGAPSR